MLSFIIGDFTFCVCTSLIEVVLISGLTIISNSMLQMLDGSGTAIPSLLRSVTIPSTITSMGNFSYYYYVIY